MSIAKKAPEQDANFGASAGGALPVVPRQPFPGSRSRRFMVLHQRHPVSKGIVGSV